MATVDTAIEAMEQADPELDPVWGLLVGAGAESPRSARSFSTTPEPHNALRDTSAPDVCENGAPAENSQVPPSVDLSESEPSDAEDGAFEVPEEDRPGLESFSKVADKRQVPGAQFQLPRIAEPPQVVVTELEGCDARILDNVLTKEECEALIAQTESSGYTLWNPSGQCQEFRTAYTIESEVPHLAQLVHERVKACVPPPVAFEAEDDRAEVDLVGGEWSCSGVNETWLFSRYLEGGHFAAHTDGCTVYNFNSRTLYTCVLYLNTCPEGGETLIFSDDELGQPLQVDEKTGKMHGNYDNVLHRVEAKQGRMLVFYHRQVHEGAPAASKYIVRTDLVFDRSPPRLTSPVDVEAYELYQKAQLLAEKNKCTEAATLFRRAFKMSPALAEVYGC